jgi:hypothetical protein
MAKVRVLNAQHIVGRMQAIADLLGIEAGIIYIQDHPLVTDFDVTKRWSWGSQCGPTIYGGSVAAHIRREFNPTYPLIQSFAHLRTRALLPWGEYEEQAEEAYKGTPPGPSSNSKADWSLTDETRKSEKNLLSDLILRQAMRFIDSQSGEPEGIPSASQAVGSVLNLRMVADILQDVNAHREKVIRSIKRGG